MPISQVTNEDCMNLMSRFPDKFFDLAFVDPEYGRKEHGGTDRTKLVLQSNSNRILVNGNKYKKKSWDQKPASKDYFDELFRVSKNQIIWGCNYYYKNFGSGRIVWDKCNDGSDQSDCEIAYNSLTDRVDLFRYMWRGMMQGKSISEGHIQKGNKLLNEHRIHPTQKPIALYFWALNKFCNTGWKILDTHLGSQSSRIAAFKIGVDFWGSELDIEYFQEGCDRFDKSISEPLFDQVVKTTQQNLL